MDEYRKSKIIELLRSTHREGMENVILFLCEGRFFTAKGGGHHKYEGGLCDHSWEVYEFAMMYFGKFLKKDSVIITTLLHDLGKAVISLGRHDNHSLQKLRRLGVPLSRAEEIAILHHDHHWTNYLHLLRIAVSLGDSVSTRRNKRCNNL